MFDFLQQESCDFVAFLVYLSVLFRAFCDVFFVGHKNEVLDERLREADDFHSQASTLAAKIAKHDQTSTKTVNICQTLLLSMIFHTLARPLLTFSFVLNLNSH